jgi:hypothetical protein
MLPPNFETKSFMKRTTLLALSNLSLLPQISLFGGIVQKRLICSIIRCNNMQPCAEPAGPSGLLWYGWSHQQVSAAADLRDRQTAATEGRDTRLGGATLCIVAISTFSRTACRVVCSLLRIGTTHTQYRSSGST